MEIQTTGIMFQKEKDAEKSLLMSRGLGHCIHIYPIASEIYNLKKKNPINSDIRMERKILAAPLGRTDILIPELFPTDTDSTIAFYLIVSHDISCLKVTLLHIMINYGEYHMWLN